MFYIIGIVVLGVVLGKIFRDKINSKIISNIIMSIIYLLLLILGIAVGANSTIINNLSTIGMKALIISLASVFGSMILSKLLYNKFYKKRS